MVAKGQPVAPEPTGVDKIKAEMQEFLDKAAGATAQVAAKTATGARCVAVFVTEGEREREREREREERAREREKERDGPL